MVSLISQVKLPNIQFAFAYMIIGCAEKDIWSHHFVTLGSCDNILTTKVLFNCETNWQIIKKWNS